jgi:hypothetical protein
MNLGRRVEISGGAEVELPEGWEWENDEEGGVNLTSEEGAGLLHLVIFEQDAGDLADPAEELYAFLEDQGIELEEDEVEDVELEGDAHLALCEYITEQDEPQEGDEEDEPSTFWLVGVATAPGNLLFGSYSCPAGEQEPEREVVRSILASMRLRGKS